MLSYKYNSVTHPARECKLSDSCTLQPAKLCANHSARWCGWEERILSITALHHRRMHYARGMS